MRTPTLKVDADGSAALDTGCNRGSLTVEVDGDALSGGLHWLGLFVAGWWSGQQGRSLQPRSLLWPTDHNRAKSNSSFPSLTQLPFLVGITSRVS